MLIIWMKNMCISAKKLAACNEAAATFDEEISYEVFLQNFDTSLVAEARTQDFIRGGITFCSLIPMRSVPIQGRCYARSKF